MRENVHSMELDSLPDLNNLPVPKSALPINPAMQVRGSNQHSLIQLESDLAETILSDEATACSDCNCSRRELQLFLIRTLQPDEPRSNEKE